ncbi:hypothetical protein C8Q78DRAFT_224828 [Trametes maxima]|nr:hypothetical protein C8Q78DRAFT_224828 [Trametes maxima]
MTYRHQSTPSSPLTTEVFSTARLLQAQLQALEGRCRTSAEHEAHLRAHRTNLQEILSMFATVEEDEARATAALQAQVEALRAAPTPPVRPRTPLEFWHRAAARRGSPPPSHSSPAGASGRPLSASSLPPSARDARAVQEPESSSPRVPLRPHRADMDADPRMGCEAEDSAGAGSQPPLALGVGSELSTATLAPALTTPTAAKEELGTADGALPPAVTCDRALEDTAQGKATARPVAAARVHTGSAARTRQARHDPRLREVTLGAHVVTVARPGDDMVGVSDSPQPDAGIAGGQWGTGAGAGAELGSGLSPALARRFGLDITVEDTPTRGTVRLGDHEIAPLTGGVQEERWNIGTGVGYLTGVATRNVSGSWGVDGGHGAKFERKTRSPARKRLFGIRAKTSIIGVQKDLLDLGRALRRRGVWHGLRNRQTVGTLDEEVPRGFELVAAAATARLRGTEI